MDSSSSACVADVRILSGRPKGSTDGVKRRRRGKTPAEKNTSAAKGAQEVERQRIEEHKQEQAARRLILGRLRKDAASEGPSRPQAVSSVAVTPSQCRNALHSVPLTPSLPFVTLNPKND